MGDSKQLVPVELIENKIYLIRSHKVILDRAMAQLYGVETSPLNQAVPLNFERFPSDFMLSLTRDEIRNISKIVMCSKIKYAKNVYAFSDQGIAMLSGAVNSPRAIQVNIAIMRAFVRLRQILSSHADLAKKLESLDQIYDSKFRVVFEAIRALMEEPEPPKRKIGFTGKEKRAAYAER